MSFLTSFEKSAQQADYDNITNVAAMYDALGDKYEEYIRQDEGRSRCVSWVLSQLSERGVERAQCIDLGCASGVPVTATLAAEGHNVTGVDVSPGQIQLAQTRTPDAKFVLADMRSWQPPEDSIGRIDAVLTFYSFPHLSLNDCQLLLSRIATWLKEDGVLALGMVDGVNGKVKWMGFDVYAMSMPVNDMVALLEKSGLEVVQSWEEEWTSATDKEAHSKRNLFFCARKKRRV